MSKVMKNIPFLPKKRTVVGGLVAVGIVIGAWLSGLFPGFGSGSGDGEDGNAPVMTSQPILSMAVPVDRRTDEIVPPEPPAIIPNVLEIVVRDESYWIRTVVNRTERLLVPANLPRIVKLAQNTVGNDDGIRVVILLEPSALFLTWKTLEKELTRAGVLSESIEVERLNGE
jgi:hypothetical protein